MQYILPVGMPKHLIAKDFGIIKDYAYQRFSDFIALKFSSKRHSNRPLRSISHRFIGISSDNEGNIKSKRRNRRSFTSESSEEDSILPAPITPSKRYCTRRSLLTTRTNIINQIGYK